MHVAVTLDGRQHVDSCQPRNNWPAINFCTHWKLTPTPGSTIVHARHSRSRSSLDWIIDQPLQRSTGSACSRRRVRATFFAIRSKQFGKFRRWRWRWEEKMTTPLDDEKTAKVRGTRSMAKADGTRMELSCLSDHARNVIGLGIRNALARCPGKGAPRPRFVSPCSPLLSLPGRFFLR